MAFMASTADIEDGPILKKDKRLTGSSESDGFHEKLTGQEHFIHAQIGTTLTNTPNTHISSRRSLCQVAS